KNGERRPADWQRLDVDRAAVLANDRGADAKAEAGTATRALRRIKRIEEFRQRFGQNSDAVVLHGDGTVGPDAADANLNAARFADFANRVLGVADEIEEYLHELVGVADDGKKPGLRLVFDGDVVAAQRMFVKL